MQEYITDSRGKKRKAVRVICDYCNKEYLKPLRFANKLKHTFCSKECSKKFHENKIEVECAFCNKKFKKIKSRLNTKSGLSFCCRKCKDEAQRLENNFKQLWPSHYESNLHTYRALAFRNLPHKCARCGYDSDIDGLDVHHKDGNRQNNKLENLIILCGTCHRIVHRKHIKL